MPIYLNALGLQFFRGIGHEVQRLNSFREFNFFIGANNSGKSTILDFLHRFLRADKDGKRPVPNGRHRHLGAPSGPSRRSLVFRLENSYKHVRRSKAASMPTLMARMKLIKSLYLPCAATH